MSNSADDIFIEDQIAKVYQHFTNAELETIAREWCGGNFQAHHRKPESGCLPIAVIVAALIATDHPLICRPDGSVMYSLLGCAVVCMSVIVDGLPIAPPPVGSEHAEDALEKMRKLAEREAVQ